MSEGKAATAEQIHEILCNGYNLLLSCSFSGDEVEDAHKFIRYVAHLVNETEKLIGEDHVEESLPQE